VNHCDVFFYEMKNGITDNVFGMQPDVPTPEESYKFFVQVWESDEEADGKAKKSAPTSEQAGAVSAEGSQPAVAAEEPEPADEVDVESVVSCLCSFA